MGFAELSSLYVVLCYVEFHPVVAVPAVANASPARNGHKGDNASGDGDRPDVCGQVVGK